MRPENDPLKALNPFLGTLRTVGTEVVRPVVGCHRKMCGLLVLVCNARRNSVAEIDVAAGEVEVLGIAIVREDVALETEPVAVVFGVALATLP